MARKDKLHDAVVEALEKDGWIITDDPYRLRMGRVELLADLGAEKLLAAEKGREKVVIEIKTFGRLSIISAFHEAVGQFRNYQRILNANGENRKLFLAVTQEIFDFFMSEPFYQLAITEDDISFFILDRENKTISKWVKK